METNINLVNYPCTSCKVCGGQKWESKLFPGKKFESKSACEKAVLSSK